MSANIGIFVPGQVQLRFTFKEYIVIGKYMTKKNLPPSVELKKILIRSL